MKPWAGDYISRPRIDNIFDTATRCKLVYVVAGAGYGKTLAVHRYIEQQRGAAVRWIQLTESDNISARYWESLTHTIAIDNSELAAKLRESGFPETLAHFKQCSDILKISEHRSRKTFLVLDDFHLIHSEEVLTFVERCAHLQVPGVCVILISRTEPKINAVSLFSKSLAVRITEEDLRFTDDEIAVFLKSQDIPFSMKDLPGFTEATGGWALAVKLLSLVLKRIPNHPDLALEVMRQNIFKLLETEAWNDFPEDIQKLIVRLSLVFDLPVASPCEILGEDSLLESATELTSFVWLDSFTGGYRIHPLYLGFIQDRQCILSDAEKQDTYRRAAEWCSKNDFYMDAVHYYAKSHQFQAIIEVLFSYPFKLPQGACEYFLDILEGLEPGQNEQNDPNILVLKHFFVPLLLLGAGRYEDARERSLDTIREWEHAGTPFSFALLGIAYSNLAYIDIYTCIITHRYDAPNYLRKCVDYFKKASPPPIQITGPFTVADIRSYACPVGVGAALPEFDRLLEASRETESIIEEHFHSMYYGYADLVACEIAFFKNQTNIARTAAHNAIGKAREKSQYSIEAMTQQYLLRIAVSEGDYPLAKEILKQLRTHLDNPVFWNRQLIYDLYVGAFYVQIGLPEMAPAWFALEQKESASEVRIPIKELNASVRYCVAAKKYNQALAVLYKSTPREPQEQFLFGELALSLLMAVAKIKTGDTGGAMTDFEKAYQLSFGGVFEMFFIELGKNLHPLAVAALNQASCDIPEEWLKMIDRKATVHAKKSDVIRNAVKREKNIKDTVPLSEREQEILNDLYHGLSREEIAANRHLSVNTVKKILQSVYTKLNANNNVDAIRIAIEKKLIE